MVKMGGCHFFVLGRNFLWRCFCLLLIPDCVWGGVSWKVIAHREVSCRWGETLAECLPYYHGMF